MKNVLISGAANGVGRAIAKLLKNQKLLSYNILKKPT